MRHLGIDAGFYFLVKPQNTEQGLSACFHDLVLPLDDSLESCFIDGDEMSPNRNDENRCWFSNLIGLNEPMDNGDFDRTADFDVCNGDFSKLKSRYEAFIAREEVMKLCALMKEHYGEDSFEIRLGARSTFA